MNSKCIKLKEICFRLNTLKERYDEKYVPVHKK